MHSQKRQGAVWIMIGLLLLAQLACQTVTGPRERPMPTPGVPTVGVSAPGTAAPPTGTPTATLSPVPSPTLPPLAAQPGDASAAACFGTARNGMFCLDAAGWHIYTAENSLLSNNQISDLAYCPEDERWLILHSQSVDVLQQGQWTTHPSGWGFGSAEVVACAADGGFWVGHFRGVSYFNGTWETFAAKEFLTAGEGATDLVYDLAVAPDGTVWVVTPNSVARYQGQEWTMYHEGRGFDRRYHFNKLALDSRGRPWVSSTRGMFTFDKNTWNLEATDELVTGSLRALVLVDDVQVWLGTLNGVRAYIGSQWASYQWQTSDLSSNRINVLAADASGRVWIGTEWGLNVLDRTGWHIYRMDNADIPSQYITAIAIQDVGPPLPAPIEKPAGALNGIVQWEDGTPVREALLEVCVETPFISMRDETPCTGQPFMVVALTDGEGRFTLDSLPPGIYYLNVGIAGRWVRYETRYGAPQSIHIQPAETTQLGVFTVSAEE